MVDCIMKKLTMRKFYGNFVDMSMENSRQIVWLHLTILWNQVYTKKTEQTKIYTKTYQYLLHCPPSIPRTINHFIEVGLIRVFYESINLVLELFKCFPFNVSENSILLYLFPIAWNTFLSNLHQNFLPGIINLKVSFINKASTADFEFIIGQLFPSTCLLNEQEPASIP